MNDVLVDIGYSRDKIFALDSRIDDLNRMRRDNFLFRGVVPKQNEKWDEIANCAK